MKNFKSFLTIILFFVSYSVFAQTNEAFFSTQINVRLNAKQTKEYDRIKASGNIKNTQFVKIGNLKSSQKKGKLTFTLPDGVSFTAKANLVKYKSEKEYTWCGHIGIDDGSVTLYCKNGVVSGHVIAGDNHYQLSHLGNGLYAWNTVDFTKALNECGNDKESIGEVVTGSNSTNRILSCSNVNVLVLFTPNALTAAGDLANVELIAGESLAQFNQSLTNSQIFGSSAQLVGVQQLAGFNETNIADDVNLFAANNLVAIQRNAVGADIVILLTNGVYGTTAGRVRDVNNMSAPFAFAIVQINNSATTNTFAHEMGHIFGARHEIEGDSNPGNAHGFKYCKGFWCFLGGGTRRSTLVHRNDPDFTRILNFSNPNVQVDGGATGTSKANNANQVKSQFLTVANYRPGNNIMSIDMTGSTIVPAFSLQTWETDIRCGTPGFNFQWSISNDGIDFITIGGNGISVNFNVGDSDFFIRVIVTDAIGQIGEQIMPVTIDNGCIGCPIELKVPTPKATQLKEVQISAYPNPANDIITFNLFLPIVTLVKLDIIDFSGRIVTTIQNEKLSEGHYNADYNVSQLPSGIYMYRLTTGDKIISEKIVISH